jgi:hypothetical protein
MKVKRMGIIFPVMGLALVGLACGLVSAPAGLPTKSVQSTKDADPGGFSRVRLHPEDGSLMNQMEPEVLKAREMGQKPIVEFDAEW